MLRDWSLEIIFSESWKEHDFFWRFIYRQKTELKRRIVSEDFFVILRLSVDEILNNGFLFILEQSNHFWFNSEVIYRQKTDASWGRLKNSRFERKSKVEEKLQVENKRSLKTCLLQVGFTEPIRDLFEEALFEEFLVFEVLFEKTRSQVNSS